MMGAPQLEQYEPGAVGAVVGLGVGAAAGTVTTWTWGFPPEFAQMRQTIQMTSVQPSTRFRNRIDPAAWCFRLFAMIVGAK